MPSAVQLSHKLVPSPSNSKEINGEIHKKYAAITYTYTPKTCHRGIEKKNATNCFIHISFTYFFIFYDNF